MVTIDIPAAQAPLTTLSVNYEATMDLDSTNAFEGRPRGGRVAVASMEVVGPRTGTPR